MCIRDRFTKWRGVYNISKSYPSKLSIQSNAHALARYSALVQECNMVPIVEPEVLMDGDHSAKECLEKTSEVIKKCFEELIIHKVDLKGIILKPNMVLAGNRSKEKITEGLDGLRERLKEYYKLGAKFTKWRGVYNITKSLSLIHI